MIADTNHLWDVLHIVHEAIFIDEIKRQARERNFNSFHFSLSGGEPTFHPGYLDILEYLADDVENTNYTSVHMTSNCSRPMKWFERYVKSASKFSRASITASFHREYITQNKLEEFAEKLDFCQRSGVRVTINSVMVPEAFDEIYKNLDTSYVIVISNNAWFTPSIQPTLQKLLMKYYKKKYNLHYFSVTNS